MQRRAFGETSANGLINEEQVRDCVPRVLVNAKAAISLEEVGAILIEQSDFGCATWATRQPHDERVSFVRILTRLEHPVEHVVLCLVNRDETSLPLIGAGEDASGIISIGVGGNESNQACSNKSLHYLL